MHATQLPLASSSYSAAFSSNPSSSLLFKEPYAAVCVAFVAGALGTFSGVLAASRARQVRARGHAKRDAGGSVALTGNRMVLQDLQGLWQDSEGNVIEVSGDIVQYHNGRASAVPVYLTSQGVSVSGRQLVCQPEQPIWKCADRKYHSWIRPERTEWEEIFRQHKEELLRLQQSLWAAASAEDYEAACSIRDKIAAGGSVLQNAAGAHQQRLSSGRSLATGVCFVHKHWNIRGVIVACEPWHDARGASGQAESVPGYHCLVDERNAAKGQSFFFKEDEIMPTRMAFPMQNSLLEEIMVPCPEICGYLPRPMLKEALERQKTSRRFSWSACREGD